MIVDDSIVARTLIERSLAARPEFEIVASAGDAGQALDLLDTVLVDVILLDLVLPGVDGMTALPEFLNRGRGAHVLVVSASATDGNGAAAKAMTIGAVDTLLKPQTGALAGRFLDELAERLLSIGHAAGRTAPAEDAGAPVLPQPTPIACLAIGASTGGVHALTSFFRALPASFDAPILVTQHLPAAFMPYFATQLHEISKRPVSVARNNSKVETGCLLVAPGTGHMRVYRGRNGVRVRIDTEASSSGCMPSADPMLASVAEVYGAGAVGVILSGMGRDGLIGATELAAVGGEILAQDQRSSVVWGMPGAVTQAGIASAVLPPQRLARRIAENRGKRAWN